MPVRKHNSKTMTLWADLQGGLSYASFCPWLVQVGVTCIFLFSQRRRCWISWVHKIRICKKGKSIGRNGQLPHGYAGCLSPNYRSTLYIFHFRHIWRNSNTTEDTQASNDWNLTLLSADTGYNPLTIESWKSIPGTIHLLGEKNIYNKHNIQYRLPSSIRACWCQVPRFTITFRTWSEHLNLKSKMGRLCGLGFVEGSYAERAKQYCWAISMSSWNPDLSLSYC